jgi:hypothetical protein
MHHANAQHRQLSDVIPGALKYALLHPKKQYMALDCMAKCTLGSKQCLLRVSTCNASLLEISTTQQPANCNAIRQTFAGKMQQQYTA